MDIVLWTVIFIGTFSIMEFNAWWMHRYVMHGFLWNLH
ncbi:MAG: beta-carotene 3-hydroxylase, partial [Nonlabens sp.]